jgi:hypothetical protein
VLESDGGRDRDRTCDPYDVNKAVVEQNIGNVEAEHYAAQAFCPSVLAAFAFAGSANQRALRSPMLCLPLSRPMPTTAFIILTRKTSIGIAGIGELRSDDETLEARADPTA